MNGSMTPNMPDLACTFIALGAGLASGIAQIGATRPPLKIPRATLLMLALLGAAFCAQLAVPGLLPLFARESSLLHRGELWRAVTALFVQDGWVTGAVFNLTILLALGVVADQLLGMRRWLGIYLGAGVATEILALAWQPHGAGNSIAVFGLAGALTVIGVGRKMTAIQVLLCLAGIGAGLGLLVEHDIHGIGFWAGAAIFLVGAVAMRGPTRERAVRAT